MEPYNKLLKIKEISDQLGFNNDCKDGIEISFEINDKAVSLISEMILEGVPFSSYIVNGIYVEFEELNKNIGRKAVAKIDTIDFKESGLNVYSSWTEFLSYKPNLTTVPDNFLILSDGSIFPDKEPIGKIKHYIDVCNFINLLISYSDHAHHLTDKIVQSVIFLHKSRLEVLISYTPDNLGEGMDGISIVENLFDDKSHRDQKVSILKEVLYGFLINIEESKRLEYLIINFGEFSKRLNENYHLFVSEFSFDNVRQEYEESKRRYLTDLNSVFSSVQSKMIGIPISLAVASLKMSTIINETTFWTNVLLLVSIIIYSAMMFMLIKNQKHTLTAIRKEYESQMNRFKHQYAEQYDEIEEIHENLNERHKFQNSSLNWFYVMTTILIIFVFALFL